MNSPTSTPPQPLPITHCENFPVASWLCPPHLRGPIAAIYAFARTADDIADEGHASPENRLSDLAVYRADLQAVAVGKPPSARWSAVFVPLAAVLSHHDLPIHLLDDLLRAFIQDVQKTAAAAGYTDQAELLDYCSRSANPVGRLLLHLYGVNDAEALQQSDAICTALQLINFWQDLSVDIPRGRFYLPDADCAAHGVGRADLQSLCRVPKTTPNTIKLIATNAHQARLTMLKGSKLVHRLPGRAGWELRLVVQGGLRILDKIDALYGASLHTRPRIRAWDAPLMFWRALVM